jgi:hypothetical protein
MSTSTADEAFDLPAMAPSSAGGSAVLIPRNSLLLLESLARELQCSAILGDVRTTCSGAPARISASISSVTLTSVPTSADRGAITSSAIRLASRPTRVASSITVPSKRRGIGVAPVGGAPSVPARGPAVAPPISPRSPALVLPASGKSLRGDLCVHLSPGDVRFHQHSGAVRRYTHHLAAAQPPIPIGCLVTASGVRERVGCQVSSATPSVVAEAHPARTARHVTTLPDSVRGSRGGQFPRPC